jgi:hypothetical protein
MEFELVLRQNIIGLTAQWEEWMFIFLESIPQRYEAISFFLWSDMQGILKKNE